MSGPAASPRHPAATSRTWLLVLTMLAALTSLAGVAPPALAASGTASYSTWIVSRDSGTVTLRFMLPVDAAQRLTGSAIPVLTVAKLGDYVLAHTEVWASGHECPASDQGYDLGKVDPIQAGTGLYGFEIVFRCPGSMSGVSLHDHALFERAPAHIDFARIEIGGRFTEQLFTATRQRLPIPDAGPAQPAGFGEYLRLGLLHILGSADRLCFLLAALLLVRRRWDLATILASLAAGYGLSILVNSAGWIQPQPALVEGFVGFLVALLAVAIALPQLERPQAAMGWPALLLALSAGAALMRAPSTAMLLFGAALFSAGFLAATAPVAGARALGVPADGHRPTLWLLPAGILGFLDGFALPALLAPLHLAQSTQVPMVVAYDGGALVADLAALALLAAGALALERSGFLVVLRPAMSDGAAAVLAGLGTFWLVSSAAATLPPTRPALSAAQALATAASEQAQSGDSLLMRKYELQGNTLVTRPSTPEE